MSSDQHIQGRFPAKTPGLNASLPIHSDDFVATVIIHFHHCDKLLLYATKSFRQGLSSALFLAFPRILHDNEA